MVFLTKNGKRGKRWFKIAFMAITEPDGYLT